MIFRNILRTSGCNTTKLHYLLITTIRQPGLKPFSLRFVLHPLKFQDGYKLCYLLPFLSETFGIVDRNIFIVFANV